jgi:phage-related protein
MAELAAAYMSLLPTLKGAGKSIGKQLDSPDVKRAADRAGQDIGDRVGKESGGRVGSALKGAIGGALAGLSVGAIVSFANTAVASFSELEDSTAAAGVVFGKNMNSIIDLSKNASSELGLSKQQVINAANTFGTYGKAAGLSGKELSSFATEQTKLAADMASFKGTSPEQAIEAIGAALRGEAEPIRAYGVMLDDATLKNEALKLGLIKTTKDALTPQQKTLAAQAAILKQTSDAQGDFARTSQSTANVAKTLEANAENLRAQIGEKLAPAFTAARKTANAFLAGFAAQIDPTIARFRALVGWVKENQAWIGPLTSAVAGAAAAYALYRGALLAGQVATMAVTAAQWALNAAMTANPIGLIVLAIAALVGALVYLYQNNETVRRVIDAVWAGIKTAIGATVGWITGTAWPALQAAWTAIGNGAKWLYENIIQPVWNGIKATIQVAWTVIRVIFATWATVFTLLWKGISFVWSKTGAPVFAAIRAVATAVWNWLRDKVFAPIGLAFRLMVLGMQIVKVRVLDPMWAGIRAVASAAWGWLKNNVFAPIGAGFRALGEAFRWVKRNVIDPVWSGLRTAASAAWAWIRDKAFAPLKAGLSAMGEVFKATKRIISAAWDGIKKAAATPINFVITEVYTKGIKKTWDKIAKSVGLDLVLPTVKPIAYANGGVENHTAQIAHAGAMRLWAEPETGGEAYIPLASSKRGRSTAILADVAGRFGYGLTQFADGGIWGWAGDLWDSAKAKAASVAKVLSNPVGALGDMLSKPLESALGSIGGGTLGKIAAQLPRKAVGALIDKAKSLVGGLATSGGGGRFSGPAMGWQNMWRIVSGAFPSATLNSAYRPGAITAVGTPSFHGLGRAIDVTPSMEIFNWLAKSFPNSSELIYSPAGARQLYKGQQTLFGEPTRGDHWDHIHWAMANGGVLPKLYDQGGWLPAGGLGMNQTGKPEAVLDPAESRALKSGLRNRPAPQINVFATRVTPRDLVAAVDLMELREAGVTQ